MTQHESKPATKAQPSHAVRRVHRFNFGMPGERFDYVATGTKEECEALVKTFAIQRRVYGDSLDLGEVEAPREEVIESSSVPEWAFRLIRKRSAKVMNEKNRASLESSPCAARFLQAMATA